MPIKDMIGSSDRVDDKVGSKNHALLVKQKTLKRGVLTKRDRLACRWVCEQGVMTVDQLWRACWWTPESNSPRYAYDRVSFLERAGFLEGLRSPHSLKTYFKATRRAQEVAAESEVGESNKGDAYGDGTGATTLIPLSTPPITEIAHADGMTELRLSIQRAKRLGSLPGVSSWRSDRVLILDPTFPKDRFYKHLPDAIWVTVSGQRIAIEYERTRKSMSRVRLKVETFSREMARADRAFDRVLWIAVPGTLSTLSQVLVSHPKQTLRTMDQFLVELKTKSPSQGILRSKE